MAPPFGPDNITLLEREQMTHCRLSGLPDLDHNVPFVRQQFIDWISYLKSKYPLDGLRIDAIVYFEPEFMRVFSEHAQLFGLGEIFTLGDPTAPSQYELIKEYLEFGNTMIKSQKNESRLFSQLDYPFCFSVRNCFTGSASCRQISYVFNKYREIGADQSLMGRFIESADIPRFLNVSDNLTQLRNGLMMVFFSEGIPIFYYGTEQGLGPNPAPGFEQRQPLWPVGWNMGSPIFVFVRMLNFYRSHLAIWDLPVKELYVDDNNYVFSRGDDIIVALTNGNTTAGEQYSIRGLNAGVQFCTGLYPDQNYCLTTSADGALTIPVSPTGEPLFFLPKSSVRSVDYFIPIEAQPVNWREGIGVTIGTIAAALFFVGLNELLYVVYGAAWSVALGNWLQKSTMKLMWAAADIPFGFWNFKIEEESDSQMERRPLKSQIAVEGRDVLQTDEPSCRRSLPSTVKEEDVEHGSLLLEGKTASSGILLKSDNTRSIGSTASFPLPPLVAAVAGATGQNSFAPVVPYASALTRDPTIVMHVALEYSILTLAIIQISCLEDWVRWLTCLSALPLVPSLCALLYGHRSTQKAL